MSLVSKRMGAAITAASMALALFPAAGWALPGDAQEEVELGVVDGEPDDGAPSDSVSYEAVDPEAAARYGDSELDAEAEKTQAGSADIDEEPGSGEQATESADADNNMGTGKEPADPADADEKQVTDGEPADGKGSTETDEAPNPDKAEEVPEASEPEEAQKPEDKAEEAPEVRYTIGQQAEKWKRLAGKDAYGTMEAVAQSFEGEGGTVVVATGDGYWDALAASGIAGLHGSPIVVTPTGSLRDEARRQIERLKPSKILVMGGRSAISDDVLAELRKLCPDGVERIAGPDAQATAEAIYAYGTEWSDTAVIATADGYWDALSIAPYAYAKHAPIFLTRGSAEREGRVLTEGTLAMLRQGEFSRAIIVGGRAAVHEAVEDQLVEAGFAASDVIRIAGSDAIETSVDIASWELETQGMTVEHLSIATSDGYWDALTGAALAGAELSPLVLVGPNGGYRAFDYDKDSVLSGHVFGGEAAVSAATWDRLLRGWAFGGLTAGADAMRDDEALTLEAQVFGDASDLSLGYSWKLVDGEESGSAPGGTAFEFVPPRTGTFDITLTVTSATGETESATVQVAVWGSHGTPAKLLEAAAADLGYHPSQDPLPGSKFGRWYERYWDRNQDNWDYGANNVAYCAMAVSYWCYKAGVNAAGIPRAGCTGIYKAARDEGRYVKPTELEPGMIVLFDFDRDGVPEHVGLVEEPLGSDRVQTLEGNTSRGIGGSQDNGGWVARRNRSVSDVLCGVRPYYE